ncbi:PREDICTED: two-component response regulator-like APRR2 isoform X2 [Nelumbo nucifera]|uniref:Two-component response regulator-like APRR2 isoform X2 n=1 Tax=Nelumbo nucifera TaxID=4432 RepID=A0A1U8BFR2_NELNU|nr:PREDICTED: two-component response regulator-like APRR2 isoform X2 [Nelumbo nucifera]
MVCTADDLLGWKDFPKGLRVLLLDEDSVSADEIKSKLEEMDYIVSTFCKESEALTAIANKPDSFHVAIVEVSVAKSHDSFRFLETAKDLPTVMTSSVNCLNTMMKCIALGAAEFLQKPLSEDKLRNIWQHVVHRAFNAGGSGISKSLKPVRETVVSMLQLQVETSKSEKEILLEKENEVQDLKHDNEQTEARDRFSAPSTPQLKQGGRLLGDGYCQDNSSSLLEKVIGDQEGESKSVDTTCNNSVAEITLKVNQSPKPEEGGFEEDDSTDDSKTGSNISSHPRDKSSVADSSINTDNPNKASLLPNSCGNKASKKKMKVDWTPELHKRFVQAVEQLGINQAIPSRILELMKVEGLTRHNVASHLQKYRMHRRHIAPKEDDWRWQHPRDTVQRVYPHKPVMAFPPYHSNHGFSASQYYPVWGHPGTNPPNVPMWGHPSYNMWQSPEGWPCKNYPGADAWGCPVMPTPQGPCATFPQDASRFHSSFEGIGDRSSLPRNFIDLHPSAVQGITKSHHSFSHQPKSALNGIEFHAGRGGNRQSCEGSNKQAMAALAPRPQASVN